MNPIFFLFLAALLLRNPAPQQQAPPPPGTARQQREAEAQRRLQLQVEQEEARRERERRALMNAMDLSMKPAKLRYTQLYIAPVMKHDPEFDLASLPRSSDRHHCRKPNKRERLKYDAYQEINV